jgi:hypothetical protein
MKLENFEQEFKEEIAKMKSLRFQTVETPEFKIPGYKFVYTKALSIAFAIPALAMVFAFFFYLPPANQYNSDLAQIEASNNRILNQINSLDNENL